MPKTILYIAQSLDGYIARPDGNLDWLTSIPTPKDGDYGYEQLLQGTEIIIMGRSTYEELLKFDMEWPYENFKTYVVTSNPAFEIKTASTYLLTSPISSFITNWKQTATKNAWIVGGSKLIASFIHQNLIDEMIITIIPKTIGVGISLFSNNIPEQNFQLIHSEVFETGVVNLTYVKETKY